MRIAVCGGTGTVGRHVVRVAGERGHDVVVVSRAAGVDLVAGPDRAADAALAGADVVVDVLSTTTLSARGSVAFFTATSRRLLAAERRVGVPHHVALSIVGIDRIDAAYYAGKLAQERLVAGGAVPHTILRAAQFHEFAGQVVGQASIGAVTLAPRTLTRPVAAAEVAEHLVRVAEGAPAGRAPDLVGPSDDTLAAMIRRLSAHDGVRRRVLEVRLPGGYGAGLASGALRGGPDAVRGRLSFDDWLGSEARTG
ncbi:NAD-dependent epimerase/dehydratase family protein [Cellulomonas sp. ES6]|uniref:SDR family oxidoreductase n=1 Tax=Cellulomonas sp. ES6 TaxID=3039384 RepID=UPI0024B82BD9|nr:NAD-dependent epimerase/dehydratase family protein [Cellulomonas sp. ES6]WHP18269.1 3-beta hydroxysteroid dehydrogenase [Cellulomonas sp. ES6]